MNNSEPREFAVALAKADTEQEVVNILQKAGYWKDASAWREYGDNPMNYSTIGNQQSSADNALVEKLVNSVDAVLMRKCLEREIQPDSDEAPQSIAEAQKEFFGIYEGKLSSIDARERTRLAENIVLAATGAKTQPSFAIIDRGEGQSPKQMPKTILSLTKSNKVKIPFVQGKFGMGGSGVLRFCSPNHNLLLVISRRNREIGENIDKAVLGEEDETRDLWGVSVVRREDPKSGEKSSHYTYLAPEGEILSFDADELPLIPGPHPQQYGCPLDSGTFIKLYEYDVGPLKTLISFDLYNRLSLLMPGVGLPVRFMERRDYKGDSLDATFAGLSVRLDDDKYKNLEPEFQTPGTGEITVEGQKLSYSIYAFKKDKKENYAKREGIIFSVNGQAHGFLPKEFFARRSVGMSYLSDSILITVDCSEMGRREQEKLFMSSRDRLVNTTMRSSIENELGDIIHGHSGLRELRNRRIKEETKKKILASKALEDIFNDMVEKRPAISRLLVPGARVSDPFKKDDVPEEFFGKEFPTRFDLVKEHPEENPRHCPINKKFRIEYETDAENDYFHRDKYPGKLTLKLNGEDAQARSLSLWNGSATLTLDIPEYVRVGEILRFETTVSDVNCMNNPFTHKFYIRVAKESKNGGGGGERKKRKRHLDLPGVTDIKEEDWNADTYKEYGFNKHSALKVRHGGEEAGYDFFVNMDNVHLKTEMKDDTQTTEPEILEARYRYGMVLLAMSILDFEENRRKNSRKEEDENNDIDDNELSVEERISQMTEAVSPVLLSMISYLGSADFEG